MSVIEKAKNYAHRAHAAQVRPFTGEAYIGHPARVAEFLAMYVFEPSDAMIAAAWLHDVVEDTPTTISDLSFLFGPTVASIVAELTKPSEITTFTGSIIKACDLLDNIGTIADVAPRAQAQSYLAKKAPQVLAICERLQQARPELAEALAQAYWRNYQLAFS